MGEKEPSYPEVCPVIDLGGPQGNAWAVTGIITAAMREAGIDEAERERYGNESFSGDYITVLDTAQKWTGVIFIGEDEARELNAR